MESEKFNLENQDEGDFQNIDAQLNKYFQLNE